jgi:hypothetical protein
MIGFSLCSFGQLITFPTNFLTESDKITLIYDAG